MELSLSGKERGEGQSWDKYGDVREQKTPTKSYFKKKLRRKKKLKEPFLREIIRAKGIPRNKQRVQ